MNRDNYLWPTVEATGASLDQRCEALFAGDLREVRAHADAFVAAVSRHLAAVEDGLLPLVGRHHPDRAAVVGAYRVAARRLERALVQLRGRMYGEAHFVRLPWTQVRADTRRALRLHHDAERLVVARVSASVPSELLGGAAAALFRAERKAPTRPHPYLPHAGRAGHAARRVAAVADRFWDTAQARVVPQLVVPPPRRHDSLVAQYLCADPHFDAAAPLVARHGLPAERSRALGPSHTGTSSTAPTA